MTDDMEANFLKDIERLNGITENYFKAAKIFYDAGVDPEDKNNMLESAKVLAVRTGYKKLSALLEGNYTGEENGNAEDELHLAAGGLTLHHAVLIKDYEAVKAIIKLGTDVNDVSGEDYYKGMTPLAVACSICDAVGAELLLTLGADPNFKTGDGYTAAAGFFVRDLSVRIKNTGEVFEKNLPSALIKTMISHGMNIDGFVDDKSNTFLNYACKSQESYLFYSNQRVTYKRLITEALLNNGADANISNLEGQTPLMNICASQLRDNPEEIAMALLENGAKVDLKDINGNTALHYAAGNLQENLAKSIAELLFDFGDPLPEAANNKGQTALQIATEKNHEALVKFLLTKV